MQDEHFINIFTLVFNYNFWNEVYHCSSKSQEEWNNYDHPNVALGAGYMIFGIVCIICYVPFLIVMKRKEFIQHPAYKLMFELAIVDMIVVLTLAVIRGYQVAMGINFCMNRMRNYLNGYVMHVCYFASCATCVILALNRFLELYCNSFVDKLFGGKRIYFWIVFPIVYGVVGCLEVSAVFNVHNDGFVLNPYPYAGLEYQNTTLFANYFHETNNYVTMILIGLFYLLICLYLLKARLTMNTPGLGISELQRMITLQCLWISVELFMTLSIFL